MVIEGETGLLVDPDDVQGLTAAVDRLLGDSALRARMGESARARARNMFHSQHVAEATLTAYEHVLTAWPR